MHYQRKEPTIAAVLSFFIAGAGQIYNGEVGKGIGIFFGQIFLVSLSALIIPVLIAIPIYIWQIMDAYQTAERINLSLGIQPIQAPIPIQNQITTDNFLADLIKVHGLMESQIISHEEYAEKKKEIISVLYNKKLDRSKNDFLYALISAKKQGHLDDGEIKEIKEILKHKDVA